MRVRHYINKYYLTVKSTGSLTRQEWNEIIPKWVFKALWRYTEGRRIEKVRYTIPFRSLNLEVDLYHGNLKGLLVLECEFSNEKMARNFQLPDWAKGAIDITENESYKNKNLALYGAPK